MQATPSGWIAQHRDRSGSPSQLLWDLVYRSFVHSRRARGCHRGEKLGVKVWDKRRKVVGEDGKGVSYSCTDCSCKPAEKTVLVEIDTWTRKQNFKANETNNPCRSSKKVLSKRIPNPLKLSIRGDAPSGAKGRASREIAGKTHTTAIHAYLAAHT